MKRHTAKAVAFPVILLCLAALMSSCEKLPDNKYQSEENTNLISETYSDTETAYSEESESVENVSNAQSDERSSDTESSYDEYVFAPPDEVKNMVWYSDYIQEKIEYEYYKNDETIFDYVPEEVVSGIETYFREGDYRMKSEDTYDDQVDWIGVMNYDMNDDGIDDLLVRAVIFPKTYISLYTTSPQNGFGFGIYMLFLANGDGSYISIKRDAWADRGVPEYILKSKTNGVYDLMPLTNGYNLKIIYDGNDSYSIPDYYDEKNIYVFLDKVSDDLVKITIECSVGVIYDNYYVAVKFVDNPFFKETIAYTCLPDGDSRMYNEEADKEIIYNEGYIMYAELTENYDENKLEEFLSHLGQKIFELRFVEVA